MTTLYPEHPDLRHEAYMRYSSERADLVKLITKKMFPFVDKYDCRVDTLLDEIEDELCELIHGDNPHGMD